MKKFNHATAMNLFRKEATKWAQFFGLLEWRIEFAYNEDDDNRAKIHWDTEGKIALITISTTWLDGENEVDPATQDKIRESAFHEVAELLLVDLIETHLKHPLDDDKKTAATHSLIRRLENCVYRRAK